VGGGDIISGRLIAERTFLAVDDDGIVFSAVGAAAFLDQADREDPPVFPNDRARMHLPDSIKIRVYSDIGLHF
jgi:hypothetical protein